MGILLGEKTIPITEAGVGGKAGNKLFFGASAGGWRGAGVFFSLFVGVELFLCGVAIFFLASRVGFCDKFGSSDVIRTLFFFCALKELSSRVRGIVSTGIRQIA